MNVTAIVQARMGSTRLPGKVMKELCGKTVLAHDIARLQQSKRLDRIVIATSDQPADEAIAQEALRCGADIFCGSEHDVLSRYHGAAEQFAADIIVRVTSDCPLLDWSLLDRMIAAYDPTRCDYFANNMPRRYPHGLDIEITSRAALQRAHTEATDPFDREHVMPYLKKTDLGFRIENFCDINEHLGHHRWTLDTQEDLAFMHEIYTRLYPVNPLFTTADILRLLDQEPALATINMPQAA